MNFYSQFEKYNIPCITQGVKLPPFEIENKYKERYALNGNCNDYQFLLALCKEGLNNKIKKDNPNYNKYVERMNYELGVFNELGFCSYVLITWDIVNYSRENGIAIGFGRGSVAGSIVFFLIGVTQIDSIKYGLFFERFLSKTRAKFNIINGIKYYNGNLLMDVDLDVAPTERNKLVKWLEQKYIGRIVKLPTVHSYKTKILVKDIAKTYSNFTEEEANEISSMIPEEYGKVKSIEEACKESPRFKEFCDKNEKIIEIANKLYLLPRHFSVHASAWIITADLLNETIPVQFDRNRELVASYVMDDALNMAIKIDLLGLRCVSLIENVCNKIGIKPSDIPLDDEIIYKQFQDFRTPHGCFQIEADTNFRVLRQIKPRNLEHLSAVIAIARPGAIEFAEVFSNYIKNGEFQSIHPFFDDILKNTAGIPIYQEDLMRMINKIGFSLEDADAVRKIVGKKLPEEMAEWEQKVKDKIKEKNLDPKIGDILWRVMDDSKNYSFNASHAISYANMCAATVYLKFKHPKEFFTCLFELTKDEQNPIEQVQKIFGELDYFNIKLEGPDILNSGIGFTIEDNKIRFGLGYIRGISIKTIEKLKQFQHSYNNKFEIFLGAQQSGINVGILSNLILVGCLDRFLTESRSKTVLECQAFNILTPKEQKYALLHGEKFNYNLIEIIHHMVETLGENGKPIIKPSRLETFRKKYDRYKKIYKQNAPYDDLTNYIMERRLLGFSYSQNLCTILKKHYPELITIRDVKTMEEWDKVVFCGEIKNVRYGISKKNKDRRYVQVTIQDTTDSIQAVLFDENIDNNEVKNGGKFEEESIVVCSGKKKGDSVFGDVISIQDTKIVLKFSQLDEENEKDSEFEPKTQVVKEENQKMLNFSEKT